MRPTPPQTSDAHVQKRIIALLACCAALSRGAQQPLVGYTPAERRARARPRGRRHQAAIAGDRRGALEGAVAGDARRRHAGAGAHARLRDRADEEVGTSRPRCARTTSGCRIRRRCSVVARVARPEGVRARRAAGGGRSDVDARAVSDGERLQRPGRRHGRSRVRELRTHRGLRAARFDGRLGEGQDRDRAIRTLVSRHQGARSGEARRGRRC